jgi:hypothetical protein
MNPRICYVPWGADVKPDSVGFFPSVVIAEDRMNSVEIVHEYKSVYLDSLLSMDRNREFEELLPLYSEEFKDGIRAQRSLFLLI